jgi:hypothetical protein
MEERVKREPLGMQKRLRALEKGLKGLSRRLAELESAKNGADSIKRVLTVLREDKPFNTSNWLAEKADRWNERANLVSAQHPEARSYVELRQELRQLFQRAGDAATPAEGMASRQAEVLLKMNAAYEALPLELRVLLAD